MQEINNIFLLINNSLNFFSSIVFLKDRLSLSKPRFRIRFKRIVSHICSQSPVCRKNVKHQYNISIHNKLDIIILLNILEKQNNLRLFTYVIIVRHILEDLF